MTRKRLVLYFVALMPFQTCCRVMVQPSCFTLPHIPWLSGLAVAQPNPAYTLAGAAATGFALVVGPVGSVVAPQPSVRMRRPISARAGCLIADLFLIWISNVPSVS